MTSDVISPPREAVAQQEKYERGHTLGIWFYHANWFATLPSLVRVGSTASTYFLRSPWSAVGEADLSRDEMAILATEAKTSLEQILEENGINIGRVMQSLRLAITGQGGGPDLMQIIEVLGAHEVGERITIALEALKDKIKE